MSKKFKLISSFDPTDTMEITVPDDENPETIALDQLGWYLVSEMEEEKE